MTGRKPARPALGGAAATVLLLLAPALLAPGARAQGLADDPNARLGAAQSLASLSKLLAQAQSFRTLFKANPSGACSSSIKSFCKSSATLDEIGTLYVAMSQQAFDARTAGLASPVRDQKDCLTCTSFATISAAEAAVSAALKQSAKSKEWSVQALHSCSTEHGEERTCRSTVSVLDAVKALQPSKRKLVTEDCLPYTISEGASYNKDNCAEKCKNQDPAISQGTFSYKQLNTPWEVQQHIRNWGGVITRLNVYQDLRTFFKDKPRGIYNGVERTGNQLMEPHAVLFVGYNNRERYWIFKNSWGSKFADGGYGRISYEASFTGILSSLDTYGVMFKPFRPPPLSYKLCPHSKRRGCYMVKPPAKTWPTKLADDLQLSLSDVLTDNLKIIKDVNSPLDGKAHIVICDLNQEVLKRVILQIVCPNPPPPKCNDGVPPQSVRFVQLRSKERIGGMVEMRVSWGLPVGDVCVRQYKVEILNLSTLSKTSRTINVQPDTAGTIIFKTLPFAPGTKGPAYLFNVVASNKAGSSAARSLSVQT